jgi:hypothetical protein
MSLDATGQRRLVWDLSRRSGIRTSDREVDLDKIEREIDGMLRVQRSRGVADEEAGRKVTAANVAARRLENLIHDRHRSCYATGAAALKGRFP